MRGGQIRGGRQYKRNARADIFAAEDVHVTIVARGDPLRYRQAKPGASCRAVTRLVGPDEPVEHAGEDIGADADAGVSDGQPR